MTVWTKIVFPALRILLWAIIALALVKIAFLSAPKTSDGDDIVPFSDFSASTYAVETGSIVNNIEVDASVIADPAVERLAGKSGYVGYWAVPDGSKVIEGQPVVEIRQRIMSSASEDEDGNPIEPADTGRFIRYTLDAPTGGVVKYVAELDEEVTKKSVVFSVEPNTLSIEGNLSPQDRYRLLDDPTKAEITLVGGPATFTCKNLSVGNKLAVVNASNEDDGVDSGSIYDVPPESVEGSSETAVKMTCPAPKKVRLFAGLNGKMTVLAGKAKDVVIVPITAVQGVMETGRVWVVDPTTGEESERDVTLGLSDGEMIEIKEGLSAGDSIRQFAPGNMEELPSEDEGMQY